MKYIKFYDNTNRTAHAALDGRYRVSRCIEEAITYMTTTTAAILAFEIREGSSYKESKAITAKLTLNEVKSFI